MNNLLSKIKSLHISKLFPSRHFASQWVIGLILGGTGPLCLECALICLKDGVHVILEIKYMEKVAVASRQGLATISKWAYVPSPEKLHSNLSKMQSFSYKSHSLPFK